MAYLDRTLEVFPDLAAATDAALTLTLSLISEAVASRGRFTVALSGGSTPSGLYRGLGSPPAVNQIPWEQVQLFFGDERCVPPGDPESNYGMVRRTLIDSAPISPANVHRMRGSSFLEAAEDYEGELRSVFRLDAGELPRFDLILLGMGPDGHTASLFPFSSGLAERERLVIANRVPQLNTDRITLSYPVLNNARAIVFLISGEDKAEALAAVLEGERQPDRYPSQGIQPTDGRLVWLLDRAAASKLGPPLA